MKRNFPFVQRNYEAIVAGTHLFVFLFVMTAVVYETQHQHNPAIGNYLDAVYFTVATLTTTGFGDITLPGTTGRLLSILLMIVGVSLFVRMAQVLFRPRRMHDNCASCGLSEHETDAVHCKRCGMLLHLTTWRRSTLPGIQTFVVQNAPASGPNPPLSWIEASGREGPKGSGRVLIFDRVGRASDASLELSFCGLALTYSDLVVAAAG